MTDEQIIKALECCLYSDCEKCPMCSVEDCNKFNFEKLTLDLINRQKAQIEKLLISFEILGGVDMAEKMKELTKGE